MGIKEEKVADINKAVKKSKVARNLKVKAEILPKGNIQYSKELLSYSGMKYRVKITFSEVLAYLYGDDLREIKRKYGHLRSRR